MSYKELPQRIDAIEAELARLRELIHWLAKQLPPAHTGVGAFVFICPHCGKNCLDTGPLTESEGAHPPR